MLDNTFRASHSDKSRKKETAHDLEIWTRAPAISTVTSSVTKCDVLVSSVSITTREITKGRKSFEVKNR